MPPNDELLTAAMEIKLTEREILVAQAAAELAVRRMTDTFYKEVGRTFVARLFIVVGAAVVGFAVARGWVKF